VTEELEEATQMRKDGNAAWLVHDNDDAAAATAIRSAQTIIEDFYKDNAIALTQKSKQLAGEMQPSPPATWEGSYAGSSGSGGVISLLSMIHQDIESDRAAAKKEEDKSQEEFVQFKKTSDDQLKQLEEDKNEREETMGKKETDKSDAEKARAAKKGALQSTLTKINKANPNCEYYVGSYEDRQKSRQIELDGLKKAKIIVQSTFAEGFLQKRA